MMNRFLSSDAVTSADLDNGSLPLFGTTSGANNLLAGLPVCTDSDKRLISRRIGPSDLVGVNFVTGTSNAGAGAGLSKGVSAGIAAFKSIVAGSNITVTANTDDITIASTATGTDPTNAIGDIPYRDANNVLNRLPIATTAGHLLTSTGTVPAWAAPPPAYASPLNALGDLLTHNGTSDVRFPIGAPGESLIVREENGGLQWKQIDGINEGAGAAIYDNTAAGTLSFRSLVSADDSVIFDNGVEEVGLTVADNIVRNPLTASQDLFIGGTGGAPSRLAKGADNKVLGVSAGNLAWLDQPAPGMPNPMTQVGSLIIGGAAGVPTALPRGQDRQILTATGSNIGWEPPAADEVLYKGVWDAASNTPTLINDPNQTITTGTWYRIAVSAVSTLPSAGGWRAGDSVWFDNVGDGQGNGIGFWRKRTDSVQAFTNLGAGNSIYGSTVNSVAQMRTIVQGAGMSILGDQNEITISSNWVSPLLSNGSLATLDNGAPHEVLAGTNGQVLAMVSGLPGWINPSSGFADPLTSPGDIIYKAAGGLTTRLPVGTAKQVLEVSAGLIPTWTTKTQLFKGSWDPLLNSPNLLNNDAAETGSWYRSLDFGVSTLPFADYWRYGDIIVKGDSDWFRIVGSDPQIANAGAGRQIAVTGQTSGNILLRTLTQGSGITLTQNADDIEIAATLTNPTTNQGDLLVRGTANLERLPIGTTAGHVLTVSGSSPVWAAIPTVSQYKGAWLPGNTSPVLTNGIGTDGDYYLVSGSAVSTTPIATSWLIGDLIWYAAGSWRKNKTTDMGAANIGIGQTVYSSTVNSSIRFKGIRGSANLTASTVNDDIVLTPTGLLAATITTPALDQSITYNGAAWVNSFPKMLKSSDVTLTSLQEKDTFIYNGTAVVNSTRLTQVELDLTNKALNVPNPSINTSTIPATYDTSNENVISRHMVAVGTESSNVPGYIVNHGTLGGARAFNLVGSYDDLNTTGQTASYFNFSGRDAWLVALTFGYWLDYGAPICVNRFYVYGLFSTANCYLQNLSIIGSNVNNFLDATPTYPVALQPGNVLLYTTLNTTPQYYTTGIDLSWKNLQPFRYYKFQWFHSGGGNFGQGLLVDRFYNHILYFQPSIYGQIRSSDNLFTLTRDATTGKPIVTLQPPFNTKNPVVVDVSRVYDRELSDDVMPVIRSRSDVRIGADNTNIVQIDNIKQIRFLGDQLLWDIVPFQLMPGGGQNSDIPNPIVPTNIPGSGMRFLPFNSNRYVQLDATLPTGYRLNGGLYIRLRFVINSTSVFAIQPICTIAYENLVGVLSDDYGLGVASVTTSGTAGQCLHLSYGPITPAILLGVGSTVHLLAIAQSSGYANSAVLFSGAQLVYQRDAVGSTSPTAKN